MDSSLSLKYTPMNIPKQRKLLLAFLVCNSTGGLAGRLAGSLALAATALHGRFFQIGFVQSLNMFHGMSSPLQKFDVQPK